MELRAKETPIATPVLDSPAKLAVVSVSPRSGGDLLSPILTATAISIC